MFRLYLPCVAASGPSKTYDLYSVYGVYDTAQRIEIARTGAVIEAGGEGWVEISATPQEVEVISALGYEVQRIPSPIYVQDFPPEDSDYHDYDEMIAEINQAATDHAQIVALFSIGQSYEGRELWGMKISDNPEVDEQEPEILFNGPSARQGTFDGGTGTLYP